MTAAVTTEPRNETPARPRMRWLPVAAVAALVLAVGAGIYRHQEHSEMKHDAARNVVVSREAQALETKVAAVQANLDTSRRRLSSRAPSSADLLPVLARLIANHQGMSAVVHDQDASSAQIVDALAGSQFNTYNNLVDRFTSSTRTVDALAANETTLQDQLTKSTCGDNCVSAPAAGDVPGRQHGTGDALTRAYKLPARWDLQYDFHCPAGTTSGYFDVVIRHEDGSFVEGGVSASTLSGRGVVYKQGHPYPASAYFDVHSNCAWNIAVLAA